MWLVHVVDILFMENLKFLVLKYKSILKSRLLLFLKIIYYA